MPFVKAVVTLNHNSGLPKDADDNTFIFQTGGTYAAAVAALIAAGTIPDFYNGANTHGALSHYTANAIDRSASAQMVEFTDITGHLDGSSAGSPSDVQHWTMNSDGAGQDLPQEVAIVTTLYGSGRSTAPVNVGATRPKQSHTGRLYLGPLTTVVLDELSGEARPSANYMSDLGQACGRLLAGALALSTPCAWSVWSRKLAAVDLIVGGVVDNAFDTQRRRGVAPTLRVPWA
jgi:hypothetical protein